MTARKPKRAKQLGVTDDQYERLLAAQGGHCALCPSTPKTRRLAVDHDHKTGKVRGLLCHRCNRFMPVWATADWHSSVAWYLNGGSVATFVYEAQEVLDEINGIRQGEES